MAERNENQKAKEEKMPSGSATNLHKNMATGQSRQAAEEKALSKAGQERKER